MTPNDNMSYPMKLSQLDVVNFSRAYKRGQLFANGFKSFIHMYSYLSHQQKQIG
jgi:hypothetical protein